MRERVRDRECVQEMKAVDGRKGDEKLKRERNIEVENIPSSSYCTYTDQL